MFCPNCGTQLPDGVRFCSNCGTKIPAMATEDVAAVEASAQQPVEDASQTMQVPTAIPVPVETVPVETVPVETVPLNMPAGENHEAPARYGDAPVNQIPTYGDAPVNQIPTYGDAGTQAAQPAKKGLPLIAKVAIATFVVFLIASGGYRLLNAFFGSEPEPYDDYQPQIIEKVDGDHKTDLIPTDDDFGIDDDKTDDFDDDDLDLDDDDTQSVTPTTEGTFAEETLEGHGYPTVYAFMELSGSDLKRLAIENGFRFYEGEDSDIWVNEDVTMVFNVVDSSGTLDEDGLDGRPAGFAGEPAIFVGVLEGYGSCPEVLEGMARCVIEDTAANKDGNVVAVCHGPSEKRFLVFVQDVDDGDYQITVYNQEAVDAGYVNVVLDGALGSTMEEIFEGYAGRPFGQN